MGRIDSINSDGLDIVDYVSKPLVMAYIYVVKNTPPKKAGVIQTGQIQPYLADSGPQNCFK